MCYSYTPDILHLLQYGFFEPVYFLDVYQDKGKTKFPKSDERFGYWYGPCSNKGDAFTYWIMLPDGKITLARSILRSTKFDANPNKRSNPAYEIASFLGRYKQDEQDENEGGTNETPQNGEDGEINMDENGETYIAINGENTPFSQSCSLDLLNETLSSLKNGGNDVPYNVTFDPIEVVGKLFVKEDRRGVPSKCTVIECNEDTGKILLEYAHGGQEWVMPNLVQEALLSVNDPDNERWVFKRIISHQK